MSPSKMASMVVRLFVVKWQKRLKGLLGCKGTFPSGTSMMSSKRSNAFNWVSLLFMLVHVSSFFRSLLCASGEHEHHVCLHLCNVDLQ